jgi:integrase
MSLSITSLIAPGCRGLCGQANSNRANTIGGFPSPDFLWATTDQRGDATAAADRGAFRQGLTRLVRFTLALLTGCRISEALAAQWDQIDLEVGRWTKPASATKQSRLHATPLSPAAVELLKTRPRTGTFLFPGSRQGEHLQHYAKPWQAICRAAHINGLRVHDLRHSFASTLASGGASLPVIGALLGHSQPATTARYAHLVDGALREATTRVGEVVTRAAKGGKVVPLTRGGRS